MAEDVRAGTPVLNIGAGRSRSGVLRPLLRRSPYLVGVDPDESIHLNPALDERHQVAIQDFAAENAERFDVVFSVFVLEHVTDPEGFLAACARVLRPGGVHFGLTVNMYQYFGLITWATTRLGVAEPLLHRIRGEQTAHYHFRTAYRMNSIGRLSRGLDKAGFRSVEFRCFDETRRYASYLPKSMRGLAPAYTRAVYALDKPYFMGHLSFRAVLGSQPAPAARAAGTGGEPAS